MSDPLVLPPRDYRGLVVLARRPPPSPLNPGVKPGRHTPSHASSPRHPSAVADRPGHHGNRTPAEPAAGRRGQGRLRHHHRGRRAGTPPRRRRPLRGRDPARPADAVRGHRYPRRPRPPHVLSGPRRRRRRLPDHRTRSRHRRAAEPRLARPYGQRPGRADRRQGFASFRPLAYPCAPARRPPISDAASARSSMSAYAP